MLAFGKVRKDDPTHTFILGKSAHDIGEIVSLVGGHGRGRAEIHRTLCLRACSTASRLRCRAARDSCLGAAFRMKMDLKICSKKDDLNGSTPHIAPIVYYAPLFPSVRSDRAHSKELAAARDLHRIWVIGSDALPQCI